MTATDNVTVAVVVKLQPVRAHHMDGRPSGTISGTVQWAALQLDLVECS